MADGGAVDELGAGHLEGDPVGDVEPGVAPGLLHRAHQVAGGALDLELGADVGVEHDEPAAGQHRGHVGAGLLGVDDGLDDVLALDEREPARGDRAVVGHRPVAGLAAPDRGLHVAAQPRAGGPGVDDEALADAEVGLVRLGDVEHGDRLDVELVGDDAGERAQAVGVGRDDGELRAAAGAPAASRPCAARSRWSTRPAPGPSRRRARRRPGGPRHPASPRGAPSGRR